MVAAGEPDNGQGRDRMQDETIRFIAELARARREARPAAIDRNDLPHSEAEAYAIAFAQTPRVAAWKIGGANPWSRRVFNNSRVFFGPLHPGEVSVGTADLPVSSLVNPLAEPELALQLADPHGATPEQRFSQMAMCFEIPSTVLPDDLKPILVGQICDRAGSGALWISKPVPFSAARIEAGLDITMRLNNEKPSEGDSGQVIGGPLQAATDFLEQALALGAPLESGQWVATGGMIPAISVSAGDVLALSGTLGKESLRLT